MKWAQTLKRQGGDARAGACLHSAPSVALRFPSSRFTMPHYGKYRGTVRDNADPLQQARLLVAVPAVNGASTAWALPCLPPGVSATLPAIDSAVWVEFESGDLTHPIWCGVYWTDSAQVPMPLRDPGVQAPETIALRTRDGANLQIDAQGIVLDNAKGAIVSLRGPVVSINHGALEIV
ncbi:phage baseplate assembly protein V [Lysobacter sp. M2-1]|uniref:phage baseplate assembly protein V n=1 Tax=Lysobacter sp. M2-1 TaxID=2916839 RepID=UPI001F573974|nr:phage baseplate assembly protein V [Lysobacter sp. M2-1]